MYGNLSVVRRLLNPSNPRGTLTGAILIGGSLDCSAEFGSQCLIDAGTFIDGQLYHRYAPPYGTPIPNEIHWIANRLAAAYVILSVKQYQSDSASNFLYDKQQQYYQMALTKLSALADGVDHLKGGKIESIPKGTYDGDDEYDFKIPGSADLRPAPGM